MGMFTPTYEGTIELAAVPSDFTDRVARRVQAGLFQPGSRRRANYAVVSKSQDAIAFGACDLWTAYNVGLNYVALHREDATRIAYRGRFWRWAGIAAVQALLIALSILVVLLVWPGARDQVNAYSWGWAFISVLLVFFGVVWPWLLVAVHRRFAAQALERIVREALAA